MRLNRLTLLITLVLITGCGNIQLIPAGELQGPVPVLRVFDGDTVELPFDEIEEQSRLVGIDNPGVYPEAEPYGPEASAYTEKLLCFLIKKSLSVLSGQGTPTCSPSLPMFRAVPASGARS